MEKIIMFLDNNPCEDPNILIVVSYVRNILETVFTIIPIVLIVLITFDIVKNVSAGNEDAIKQNQKIIIKRIIYSIALFFVVPIVNVVFSIFGTSGNIQLINGDVENQKLNYLSCWDNAKNKKTIDSFTISAKFEGNGGKVNGTNEKRCGGSSSCEIILPNATKEGSRFIGWDINPSCNNAYKERILTIKKTNTSNVTTLYACFEEQEIIEENIGTENNTNNNKDNNTNNNTNNNKDNNTNNNTNNNLQKHIIFVGDSRMCGIYDAVDELSTESFVCEIGKSIQWFNDSAIDEINNIIKKDSTKKYVIIINLGVNNPYNGNAEQYYESYNELKNGSWSNHDVIITSVDPVDETRYDYVSNFNTIIEKFNTDLKDNLNSNIKYCDTYSYVKELIKDSNYIEPDGLHYKSQTYSKIYTKLKECAK